MPSTGLKERTWTRFLRGPDAQLLEELYAPALERALTYDRCCAFFSSSVLAAAARGFGGLIQHLLELGPKAPRPSVRLVVNEELSPQDVAALLDTGDVTELRALLKKRFKKPKDLLRKRRLEMLAWMVREGFLDLRVGVMRVGGGVVHAKFGIVTDAEDDSIVFSGSGNESAQGLLSNYEILELSTSWEDPQRYRFFRDEFDALWVDAHPDVHTLTLPEAIREELIKLAPKEPPLDEPSAAEGRQKAAMAWQFISEAPFLPRGGAALDHTAMVDLWPHQRHVVREVAEAWPDGRLLCDEVGMGKTIEATLAIRRLLGGKGVKRALFLVPAGLLVQWQDELREKGGLLVPRLEGTTSLLFPDGSRKRKNHLGEALREDLLLMSRETARTESNRAWLLKAEPWDLVLMDEAHAARRARQEEGEFNTGTLLLDLLRHMQLSAQARSLVLLSATPMQTQPWEPWDLLGVLGEGGRWLAEFSEVREYYAAVRAIETGTALPAVTRPAAHLIAGDDLFPTDKAPLPLPPDPDGVARTLSSVTPKRRDEVVGWLRRGSPLGRRMHRNTKTTLRRYFEMGRLERPPAGREVQDIVFDYDDQVGATGGERELYVAVGRYIDRRFARKEGPSGIGFVKTIYQRRAASCPYALGESLRRRLGGLKRVIARSGGLGLIEEEDIRAMDLEESLEEAGLRAQDLSAAYPSDPKEAEEELGEVVSLLQSLEQLGEKDTKRDKLYDVLRPLVEDDRRVLIFSQYTDTVEYLRDSLVPFYGAEVGAFTGDGGKVWEGGSWKSVSKEKITELLREGNIRFLICNDAASEGLNLQAASGLINYDLPWNPSRVEQRIGRIDRIGQARDNVQIVNLYLRDSVDEKVYTALRKRCGLFERFVGPMQPVLARARRMIDGREPLDLSALDDEGTRVEGDPLASEAYFESDLSDVDGERPSLTRDDLEWAMGLLDGTVGPRVTKTRKDGVFKLTRPGHKGVTLTNRSHILAENPSALPLDCMGALPKKISQELLRPGERLPLVVAAHCQGPFRSARAFWISDTRILPIESLNDLRARMGKWDGSFCSEKIWVKARLRAEEAARKHVVAMELQAQDREQKARDRQLNAVRLRLLRELGRYLVALDDQEPDPHTILSRQLARDMGAAGRIRRALDLLHSVPTWDAPEMSLLQEFRTQLTESQRVARRAGSEVDAALNDPRWRLVGGETR